MLATRNPGKVREFNRLLAPAGVTVIPLPDEAELPPEDGDTFEANAIKKAREVANATMMLTLADDSGLEVDALGGAPGVRSARFAGERATDAENNAALLTALEALDAGHPDSGRNDLKARFRCVLALVDPFVRDGEPVVVDGTCEGRITRTPRGSGGFGYDPLFLVEGTDRTMAELSEDEKNRISHRARATQHLRLALEKTLHARDAITHSIVSG